MVLRLTKYPSNQYQGIVVGVVHQTAVEDDCSGEAYIDRLVTLFQEISEARAPGSKFVKIPHVAHEYQLQGSVEEEKQYLAVHLLQLFNVH